MKKEQSQKIDYQLELYENLLESLAKERSCSIYDKYLDGKKKAIRECRDILEKETYLVINKENFGDMLIESVEQALEHAKKNK